ncbi:MAG: benzoyl-CoA reductase, bzd-type, subunit N [Candidatus Kariarchaeaceae archaeon]|jgi:benzoyl-CoA reductase subunit C
MFQKFKDWRDNRHDYARDWQKKSDAKILGYFCTYVPEEILYAAGVLPVRILGSHEPQDVTEPHIFGMFCPFSRDCLAQGLKGRFKYLNGIMIAQSCLHIRQSYSSWEKHVPTQDGFAYYLNMPHKIQSPRALPFLKSELELFKERVEEWVGKKISDKNLEKSIDIYNENRRLQRQIYELRKEVNPPLTGEEAMYVTLSSQMVDKAEHNIALRKLLEDLPDRKLDRDVGTRLMILGSEDDDIEFLNMVESVGSTFVIDDHCTGSRYFWNEVEIDGKDLLEAIADRYIKRPACPTKDWEERRRVPHVMQLAHDYDVDGAILIQQKFCDPHELEIPTMQHNFDLNNIPTLFLELDVTVPIGQFRTRVEAFLEMIDEEDLF